MNRKRWHVEAAGLPCVLEKDDAGEWVATLASASVGRAPSLTTAIVRAGGGLVSADEAEQIVASVVRDHAAGMGR